ncbi:MAG: hypothetical protein AABY87_12195 [bacterium]
MTEKKTAEKAKSSNIKKDSIAIPLTWNIPGGIITRFASNMVVQLVEGDCRILFFEAKPDIDLNIHGKIEERIQAECVANIIINANKLPKFIEILQMQYDRYIKK